MTATENTGCTATELIHNEHFRVTRWEIEPGGHIPMHVHEYEYVVCPSVNGEMWVITGEGEEIRAELRIGEAYGRAAGSSHRVENRSATERVVFVEVEKL